MQPEMAGNLAVHIEAQGDGTYMVGKMDTESVPEGAPGEMQQDMNQGMQKAATLDEALDIARQLLQDTGQAEQADMSKGYIESMTAQ